MNPVSFSQEYRVRFSDTDQHKLLHPAYMMRYFEEIAILQSEALHVGFEYYNKNQVVWMMHQIDVRINQLPEFNQHVIARTVPYSLYRFMGFRKYSIIDALGNEMITADSAWLFIHTVTKRPVRVYDDVKKAYGHMDAAEHKLQIEAIPAIQHINHEKHFSVRKADIDVNQHVNHVHYVTWALETIPMEITDTCKLQRIRIDYKKETLHGSTIHSRTEIQDLDHGYRCLHAISDQDGQEKCVLMTEFARK
jgi:medium-chain acyl-[acyl-carrier-protein] hydrolase